MIAQTLKIILREKSCDKRNMKREKKTKWKIVDKQFHEVIDSLSLQSTILHIMTTKKFASTFRWSRKCISSFESWCWHLDFRFWNIVIRNLHWEQILRVRKHMRNFFSFESKFERFLMNSWTNDTCAHCDIAHDISWKFLFFLLSLRFWKFLTWASMSFLRLLNQDTLMLFLFTVLILLLCIENQRIERKNNYNTFALSKR